MNHQSQDYYGPYIIPFHQFVTKLSDVEYFYSLSKLENRLLMKFAGSIERTGYKTNLSQIKFHKRETWAEMCRVSESHISDYFRALQDLGIIEVVKVGKRNHHKFAQPFLNAMLSDFVLISRQKPVKKKKSGDKISDRSETGDLIGPKPGTYKVRNRGPIRSETGDLCSNIEDLSSLTSLPPPHISSFPPDPQPVENGDNLGRLERLTMVTTPECAKEFLWKLRKTEQSDIDRFLDYIAPRKLAGLGSKQISQIWGIWSDSERDKPMVQEFEEMQLGMQ